MPEVGPIPEMAGLPGRQPERSRTRSGSSGAGRWLGQGINETDVDPLVDLALGARAGELDAADFAGIGDMCAAVRLEIEPDDLDRPDFLDCFWQEIDLRADQVRDLYRLCPRMNHHPDVTGGGDLLVCMLANLFDPYRGEVRAVHFEVHASVVRLHVAAGDERLVVAEHDAAQDVQGGMHAHQRVAAIPVDRAGHRCASFGEWCGWIEEMDDVVTIALAAGNGIGGPIERERPMIGGLAATTGVERRAIEDDTVPVLVHADHPRVEFAQVAVGLEELIGSRRCRHDVHLICVTCPASWLSAVSYTHLTLPTI